MDNVDEIIDQTLGTGMKHSGVKGMKWGVRRSVDPATGLVRGSSTRQLKRALKGLGPDEQLVVSPHGSGSGKSTGLVPRVGSADQIAQERIASKISKGGVAAVSNADIQAFTRRLQLQKDLDRVLAEQSAAEKAKADGFIKATLKKQAGKQSNRVIDKVFDVAVEQALKKAGVRVAAKGNKELGENIQTVAKRLAPKKGK